MAENDTVSSGQLRSETETNESQILGYKNAPSEAKKRFDKMSDLALEQHLKFAFPLHYDVSRETALARWRSTTP